MHHVEGAQCGLPVLYHEDGGGIVETARRYGIGFRDDVAEAIGELHGRYGELRRRVLDIHVGRRDVRRVPRADRRLAELSAKRTTGSSCCRSVPGASA